MKNKPEVCYFCKKNEEQYREELHPDFKALKKDRRAVYNKAKLIKDEINSKQFGNLNNIRNDHLKPLINEYEALVSKNNKLVSIIKEINEQTQFNEIDPYEMGSFKEMVEFIMHKFFNKDFKYIQHGTDIKTIKVCNDCLKKVNKYKKTKRETEIFPPQKEERGIIKKSSGKELDLEVKEANSIFNGCWIPDPLEE